MIQRRVSTHPKRMQFSVVKTNRKDVSYHRCGPTVSCVSQNGASLCQCPDVTSDGHSKKRQNGFWKRTHSNSKRRRKRERAALWSPNDSRLCIMKLNCRRRRNVSFCSCRVENFLSLCEAHYRQQVLVDPHRKKREGGGLTGRKETRSVF